MKLTNACLAILVIAWLAPPTSAVTISTVRIGHPGNAPDARYLNSKQPNLGSVGNVFNIGKTEVTNAQYVEFLNAVAASDPYELYNVNMAKLGDGGIVRNGAPGSYLYAVKAPQLNGAYVYNNKPVVFVGWADVLRFVNWLHNGQPTGAQDASTTEDGAYALNGVSTYLEYAAISRNSNARWFLPNENEWYKAAYYNPATGGYYEYPTGSNSMPNNNQPSSDTGNSANYFNAATGGNTTGDGFHSMTDVGAYALSISPNGTFDQGGNAREWNETRFGAELAFPGLRGSSSHSNGSELGASSYGYNNPRVESSVVSFRVASPAAIPEPSTAWLTALAAMRLWMGGKRAFKRQ
jgi:formylglycine-generating enzyme required for sulfatase activity